MSDVATEALFTKYNITYSQFWSRIAPNTDLINEINSFYEQENFTTNQAALVAKVFREGLHCKLLNDVTDEFKNDFLKLDLNGVATLMHILKAKEENMDGAIACSLSTNYPATWENTPTKDFLAKYDVTNPYRSFEDKIEQEQKVTLTNGKEVEFKKFLELLYTGKKEELTFYWNKLSSEDKKKLSQEMTLTAAYKLFKDQIDFQQANDLVATITSLDTDSNIPDLFKRASDMNEQQLHEQEESSNGWYRIFLLRYKRSSLSKGPSVRLALCRHFEEKLALLQGLENALYVILSNGGNPEKNVILANLIAVS